MLAAHYRFLRTPLCGSLSDEPVMARCIVLGLPICSKAAEDATQYFHCRHCHYRQQDKFGGYSGRPHGQGLLPMSYSSISLFQLLIPFGNIKKQEEFLSRQKETAQLLS
jgi:hypothetical protein